MDRRSFLGMAPAAMLLAETRGVQAGCQTNAWRIDPAEPGSLAGVLREIQELGYSGFETGFRNLQPRRQELAKLRSEFAERRLTLTGVHIFLNAYDEQTKVAPAPLIDEVLGIAAELRSQMLILSGAPAGSEAAKRKAEALNAAGGKARATGMMLGYHNHAPEFGRDGEEIEALLSMTDPARVQLVLDAGHAYLAKADLPKFVRRHSARLAGMHFRDFSGGEQVPLGEGDFPLHAVGEALRATKWSGWAINEEERGDGSKPGRLAAELARAALKKEFGI